jgi:hypothetical protein
MPFRFLSSSAYPYARIAVVLVLVLALLSVNFAETGGASSGASTGKIVNDRVSFPTAIQHVVVVFFENQGLQEVQQDAGYLSSTCGTYACAGDYFSPCHPSEPNYLAVFSGSTQGRCGTDQLTTFNAPNMGSLVSSAGETWLEESEGAPGPCSTSDSGAYIAHHNPAVFFDDILSPRSYCNAHVIPFSTPASIATSSLPNYVFVNPTGNNVNSIPASDVFAQQLVTALEGQSYWSSTVVFFTYDEACDGSGDGPGCPANPQTTCPAGLTGSPSTSNCGGQVFLSAVSPYSKGQGTYAVPSDHYDLMTTVEWLLGLGNVGAYDAQGHAMKGLFSFGTSPPTKYSVSFTADGLPTGTNWSVTLNGSLKYGTSPTISFSEPNGSYGFSVLSPVPGSAGTRYVATPTSGTAVVAGANLPETISWSPQYQLSAVASPSTGGTVSPSAGWYSAGDPVSILSTPASGEQLWKWTGVGTGSYNGVDNPAKVTANGPIVETALFVPTSGNLLPVYFNETGLPAGKAWNVSLNGTWESSSNASVEFLEVEGSYGYVVETPIQGSNSSARYLTNVSSGSLDVGTTPVTTEVPYLTQFYVNVSVSPVGAGIATPSSGWFGAHASVAVAASPAAGFSFARWNGTGTGNYSGTDLTFELAIGGSIAEVASFDPSNGPLALLLQATGLPNGTSWSAYVGGSDWTTNQSTISVPLGPGAVGYAVESPIRVASDLQYVAQPSSGMVNLTGGSVGVTVSYLPEAFLAGTASGAGTVALAPTANGWYLFGTTVEFNATAPPGSVFVGWSGSGIGGYNGTANPVEIKVAGPVEEVARFEATAVTGSVGGGQGGTETAAGPSEWAAPVALLTVGLGSVGAIGAGLRLRAREFGQRVRRHPSRRG